MSAPKLKELVDWVVTLTYEAPVTDNEEEAKEWLATLEDILVRLYLSRHTCTQLVLQDWYQQRLRYYRTFSARFTGSSSYVRAMER